MNTGSFDATMALFSIFFASYVIHILAIYCILLLHFSFHLVSCRVGFYSECSVSLLGEAEWIKLLSQMVTSWFEYEGYLVNRC